MWTDTTRKKHARKGLRYSSDLTGGEWAVLEPVLPVPPRLGRPRKWTLREIVDGIFYLLRTGSPWRMLPKDFPPVSAVQRYFYAVTIRSAPRCCSFPSGGLVEAGVGSGGFPVPWHQLVDTVRGVFGDASEDVGEPGLSIDTVHLVNWVTAAT